MAKQLTQHSYTPIICRSRREDSECHEPESHLIPLLQAASDRRPEICIYGNDYDTPDGVCIRDYVHVVDLCNAHMLALEKLLAGANRAQYNLRNGNDNGYSVAEVIDTVKRVTGKQFTVTHAPRRETDAARLVADSARARAEFDWVPRYPNLDTIIEHSRNWENRL